MIVITAQLHDCYRPDRVIGVLPTPVATVENARQVMDDHLAKVREAWPAMLPVQQFVTTEFDDGATEPNHNVLLYPVTHHSPGEATVQA